ncbi:cell division protein FtsZ [Anaplasma capra]|uniref:cell division protein FtsZ n=1 Tax=Anaplasma capra TaxID=1562740 RepID=UPI0021D6093B|nr:cell division protein FtsZ [Anaplasma capra]MCU7611162.1 cell division protein FtsZ [Anaplasma capra]
MSLDVYLPDQSASTVRPRITVLGVGGAGGNAVNNMIQSCLQGVNFIVANTDAQALDCSLSEKKIQLGMNLTKGLGAGSLPEVGRGAAEESIDEIMGEIADSNMLFITAGMGGGTGTGAAPVIAKAAKENKILTVGVVTKPFHFEGAHRMKTADLGLEELQRYVDTLIIIPNQNLFRIANENTTFADAFRLADTVLHTGVRGITDLMVMPGLINLDFADIKVVMGEMGKAMMGTGEAEGDHRAVVAAEAAISNPLLDNISMKGARGILINITGGLDLTLFEVDAAANRIREEVDDNANIIFGSTFNEENSGKIRVSVLATGIDSVRVAQKSHSVEQQKPLPASGSSFEFENELGPEDGGSAMAYYKPSLPEEDVLTDAYSVEKQPQKAGSFNWSESFDVPAFLRKKEKL